LAQALLEQGAVEEAEGLTVTSERRGGDDLRTSIARRCVRAECAARRGAVDEALRIATQAVAIADATDALFDQGEARMSLAAVLRAARRDDEANGLVRAAAALFERKEATVKLAARPAAARETAAAENGPESVARRLHDAYVAAYNTCDWDAMRQVLRDDFV